MGTKNYDNAADLITFSRASGGTSLRKISYGSELVTNGTFDADTTGWTSASGGVISWVAGEMQLEVLDGDTNGGASQTVTVEVGKVYTFSVDVTALTENGYLLLSGASSFSNNGFSTPQSFSHTFVAATTSLAISVYAQNVGAGPETLTVDNVSVKEVLFDQPDGTLTLFNHPDNIPRIDYNPDGTVKGLLVEEARTNLVTYSEDFTDASWPKSDVTVSASSEIDPAGGTNAYELIESATTANHLLNKAGISGPTSSAHTNSTYAKANTRNWIRVQNQSPFSSWVNFNLSTGEFGLSGGGEDSFAVENVGGGWYRISLTSSPVATGTGPQIFVIDSDRGGPSPSYLGDGTSSILIYGAQFEEGSFPTSYISTSGSTATRAADLASIPVADFGYNQDQGTVVVEVRAEDTGASAGDIFFQLYDGTSQNTIGLDRFTTNFALRVKADNVTQVASSFPGSQPDTTTTYTVAATYKVNDFAYIRSGSTLGTDTSGTVPDGITTARMSDGNFNGHIKSIQYYPRRLTNTQLQELTT